MKDEPFISVTRTDSNGIPKLIYQMKKNSNGNLVIKHHHKEVFNDSVSKLLSHVNENDGDHESKEKLNTFFKIYNGELRRFFSKEFI